MPHGNAKGREALDAALALSDINQISVIFINEGVFHLVKDQQPNAILTRDYTPTLKILALYDITQIYACEQSLTLYGLAEQLFSIDVEVLSTASLTQLLHQQDCILQF